MTQRYESDGKLPILVKEILDAYKGNELRQKHGFTMSDWQGMTDAEKEQAKKSRLEIRFGAGGQQLPFTTFQ